MSKVLLGGVAILSALLAGCSSAPGTTTLPSSPPTAPSTPAEVAVENLVVGGTSFSINFDDGTGQTIDFASDPQVAIDSVAAALREEATIVDHPQENCSPAETGYAWGGFEIRTGSDWLPEEQRFAIWATGVTPVPIETVEGAMLNGDITDLFDATPEQRRFEYDDGSSLSQVIYFDVQDLSEGEDVIYPDDSAPWGGYVSSTDGLVTHVMSPINYAASGGC